MPPRILRSASRGSASPALRVVTPDGRCPTCGGAVGKDSNVRIGNIIEVPVCPNCTSVLYNGLSAAKMVAGLLSKWRW